MRTLLVKIDARRTGFDCAGCSHCKPQLYGSPLCDLFVRRLPVRKDGSYARLRICTSCEVKATRLLRANAGEK